MLLKADVTGNPGYFGERLQAARSTLVKTWQRRTATLRPEYRETDIVGALLLAGELFRATRERRKILIVLSDMRHHTRDLDLETGETVPGRPVVNRTTPVPHSSLQGVEVYVLGVDGAGKTLAYWQSLERFWRKYLKDAGADMKAYSILRELPNLLK
jgi:hypothetical protein